MSVIFDALNKLDKEKRAPKTGMLIVGAGSIVDRRRGVSAPLIGVSTLTLVLLGAAAWWWTTDVVEPVPAAGVAAIRPSATARPTTGARSVRTRSARTPTTATALADDLAVVPVTRLPATAARDTEGDVFDGIAVIRIGDAEVELLIQAEDRTLVLRF